MFRLTFRSTDIKVAAMLRTKGVAIVEALRAKLTVMMIRLQAHIVRDKLSGQVLAHRTGTLAGSIRAIAATVEGNKLAAAVQGGGGTAFYGAYHEYGVSHPWKIVAKNGKALAFMMDSAKVFAKSVTHPGLKERSFMRSALADMSPEIVSQLQLTLDEMVKEN